jgi:hypothetical protein
MTLRLTATFTPPLSRGDLPMKTREEIQSDMESGLAASQEKIDKMKADLEAAGDDASEEALEALEQAESLWDKARQKYDEIAAASDEEFEELRDSASKNWDELTAQMESGWNSISERFKSMFS